MNNRIFIVLILVLSCAILLVGGTLIGAALYLQNNTVAATDFAPQTTTAPLIEPSSGPFKIGSAAPEIRVLAMDGKTLNLSDFRGKPVVINFWASWCGPCTAEMKAIEAVYQKHKNDDIVILAINQGESEETIKGYGELWKLNFRLTRDANQEAGSIYKVQALPTTVFVDKQGNIHEYHIGGPMTQEFLEKRVNDLLAP